MRQISVRDFQLKASSYLKELPIVLTQYGKPVATVNTFVQSVNTPEEIKLPKPYEPILAAAETKAAHLGLDTPLKKGPCFACKYIKEIKLKSFIWDYDPVTEEICGNCWTKAVQDGSARE